MKKIFFALFFAMFAQASVADLATDRKIYRDTVIWPILSRIVPCQPGVTGGLPAKPTQAQMDVCLDNAKGLRYPTLEAVQAEVKISSTLHAKIARGTWKIKTAQTPEELPYWNNRCGALKVTTFEECEAIVNKWSNVETKAMYLTRSYIVDENGNWVDHRFAYTIQPGWAKRLGHTNTRVADMIWNSKLPELKAKLAAAAPK